MPSLGWPMGKPVVHVLSLQFRWESSAAMGGPGIYKKQAEQALSGGVSQ